MRNKHYRRNLYSLLLTLVMIISVLPSSVLAAGGTLTGDGSADAPYLIEDAADLEAFRDLTNQTPSADFHARLTNDIDLGGQEWTAIAPASGYVTEAYAGTFDGDFHKIQGLSVNASTSNQGLFGLVNGATVKNLAVEGNVTGTNYVGGIIGKLQQGTIENCSFSGTVQATGNRIAYASGITGYAGNSASQKARIIGCVNAAAVSGTHAGGMAGYAKYTEISDCYNTGAITGTTRAGGIGGQLQNNCSASGCYNIGNVSGCETAADICGFLYSSAAFTNCYYQTIPSGAGTGTVSGCSEITTADDLLAGLGSAYTADTTGINNGYPVLSWQALSAPPLKDPHIMISGSDRLYMTNDGVAPQTTLAVQYVDMEDMPEIIWNVRSGDDIITVMQPENPDSSNKSVIVTAKGAGTAVVSAQTADGMYQDELEIQVIPFVTTVEMEGTAAVGQTVYARVNILGGDEYDYERYPALQIQWKYLTNEDYTAGNTGSSSYRSIPGAVDRGLTITEDLKDCYLSFEILLDGAYKTPGSPVRVISADEGVLETDKRALKLDTSDIKAPTVLTLPQKGVSGSSIRWTSSEPEVINAETGAVMLPSEGIMQVVLTAELSYGEAFAAKSFTIRVYSQKVLDEEKADKLLRLRNAAAALGDSYTMHPVFGRDTNVKELLRAELSDRDYSDIGVSVKSVQEVYGGGRIEEDGAIQYFYADPNHAPAVRHSSYRVIFTLSLEDVAYDITVPVILYWDADRVKAAMTEEILNRVEVDTKGKISQNLSLPKVIDNKKWTQISWTSSDPDVLAVSDENQQTADGLFQPYIGIVKRGETDRTVTLTASFTFMLTNDVTGSEAPIRLNQVYEVTVAALEKADLEQIQQKLEEKLDAGFSAAGIRDVVTGLALTNEEGQYVAYNDILFPKTSDFGVDGKYNPVVITSDSDAIKTPEVNNAARAAVYRPAPGSPDAEATVMVSIADKDTSVKASRIIRFVIPALTAEEIRQEKALMERVKAAYFDGIKGENPAADNVSKNLTPFLEVYEKDGELVWVRRDEERINHGIVPTAMKGWEELEAWRLFKSSNSAAVTHENLLVSLQNNGKAVTISSALSSEALGKYGELYQSDPEKYKAYADCAELYYQEVSCDLVIRGRRTAAGMKPVAVEEKINVSFRLQSSDSTLISSTDYTNLDETVTVYDVFKRALKEHGYTYKNKGSYVYSITTPEGVTLEEFDEGANSGWMYKVNNKIPDVYMGGYGLKDGDEIVVFFTKDYTEEKGLGGFGGGNASYTIAFDTNGGSEIKSVRVVRDQAVKMPEAPTREGYRFDGWYTDQECTVAYDFNTKATRSFTLYAKWIESVSEPGMEVWINPFTDVRESDWFYESVQYADTHQLFRGISETEFAPEQTMTRAMLVTVLYRNEDQSSVEYSNTAFEDVRNGEWYAAAVCWAQENGIVKGCSDREFVPERAISRQEIAVILKRYAEFKGETVDKIGELSMFTDKAKVSDWASDSMVWAVGAGLLNGRTDGEIDPHGKATRAEAASMMMRFLNQSRG